MIRHTNHEMKWHCLIPNIPYTALHKLGARGPIPMAISHIAANLLAAGRRDVNFDSRAVMGIEL